MTIHCIWQEDTPHAITILVKTQLRTLPRVEIAKDKDIVSLWQPLPEPPAIEGGIPLAELLVDKAQVFPSKGEMRKMTQNGGVMINKEKIADAYAPASTALLLNDRYIIVQKGKKNYFLLIAK